MHKKPSELILGRGMPYMGIAGIDMSEFSQTERRPADMVDAALFAVGGIVEPSITCGDPLTRMGWPDDTYVRTSTDRTQEEIMEELADTIRKAGDILTRPFKEEERPMRDVTPRQKLLEESKE